MHRYLPGFALATALFTVSLLAGCTAQEAPPIVVSESPPPVAKDGHDHAHPDEGPHGGHLVELGNEEYHAELVHDDKTGSITVYLLDGAAKAAVPIEATELTINLKHEGKGEQFKLAASADQGDPSGKASRFVSTEKQLAGDLDREGADAQLVVTINGKQYRGKIEHDHEHAGHKHDDPKRR